MKKFSVGTDIGGSHISCAIVDLERRTISRESFVTQKIDNQANADVILEKWSNTLTKAVATIDRAQLAGIGFAMPGPFKYDLGVAMFTSEVAKYQSLFETNVSQRLEALLQLNGDCRLRYVNDAVAFAVGEAWAGHAAGARRSLSITLGTGFGSGFLDGGVPVVDREDVPKQGCVWNLPYHGGIADDLFTTRWFIKQYAERSGHQVVGVKEIAEKTSTDVVARDLFAEFGANLGTFLGPLLKNFGADVLVIGGNISAAYLHFRDQLEVSLADQRIQTPVRISYLKEDAALLGSARLFDEVFWQEVRPLLSKM